MNLNKSLEFFDPSTIKDPIHIIGCGAIGSNIAEELVRAGVEKLTLWDFDVVEEHNLANQLYTTKHINMLKTIALTDILQEINPNCKTILKSAWTPEELLTGHIFCCVDNIDLRREIVKTNIYNPMIKSMFDIRMSLTEGKLYAADWKIDKQKETLLATMNYTHDEAKESIPVSACGFELSVAPTVKIISSFQVANFMNFIKTNKLKKFGMIDAFEFFTEFYNA